MRAKALGALSAMVQNYEDAESAFLARGGLEALRSDCAGIGRRLKVKALFMLQWLLQMSEKARAAAKEIGLANVFGTCVDDEDNEVTEYAALALVAMLKEGNGAIQSVRSIKAYMKVGTKALNLYAVARFKARVKAGAK